jgi:hypothetical protein
MRQWLRSHLTYANVMVTILAFIVLGGGSAVALSGTNRVQSDDLGPGAQVKAPDVAENAVNSDDVVNESLTGADIKNRSGVDTCPSPATVKLGAICAGSDGGARQWADAIDHCAALGLRLPSVSEAAALATLYNVPGVGEFQYFWTDEQLYISSYKVMTVNEDGFFLLAPESNSNQTVCVTDPSA